MGEAVAVNSRSNLLLLGDQWQGGWTDGQIKLHFASRAGKGTPIVFIPGLASSLVSFKPLLENIVTDRPLVIMEPRGSGLSDKPAGLYSVEMMAADVLAVAENAKLTRPFDLVGVSMGGMIAQSFAITKPADVRNLCLISSHASAHAWTRRLFDLRIALVENVGANRQAELVGFMLAAPEYEERTTGGLDSLLEFHAKQSYANEAYRAQLMFCREFNVLDDLARLDAHILSIGATEDVLIPPAASQQIALACPNGRYAEISEATHLLLTERPDELVKVMVIHGFLD